MGKHQLELAIGFFLLGGEPSSAINVCVKNLQDEQLALVICRLVDGQGGTLESDLIKKYILPSALQRGDFWLASLLKVIVIVCKYCDLVNSPFFVGIMILKLSLVYTVGIRRVPPVISCYDWMAREPCYWELFCDFKSHLFCGS